MTNTLTTEFIIGGVAYAVPPLHFHWHKKVAGEFKKATELLDKMSAGGLLIEADPNSPEAAAAALDGLTDMVPLVEAGLRLAYAGIEQQVYYDTIEAQKLGTEPPILHSLEDLERALTLPESIGIIRSTAIMLATMMPQGNDSGEADAAAENATSGTAT